jgi:4-amino-4-deoxy-L-arabinose transferase-like glycosyltransferase
LSGGFPALARRLGDDPQSKALVLLALAILAVRVATLGSYPLMDTSEARYGEIARVMLATGNFVTPQEIPGLPFWAKPPLYAWLSAGSMYVLGVNEFALRLPSFLCGAAVLALTSAWAARLVRGEDPAIRLRAGAISLALLAGSFGFFVAAGAVMTDPTLALCTTAMLLCFHVAGVEGRPCTWARYGFFIAGGLAMLAKGPVIALYVGLPVLAWALLSGSPGQVLRRLPWLGGTVAGLAICLPWYALAEARTPGFLQYFLVGEHLMRFLRPGWEGDRYGTAHVEPLGTIWLYGAGALGLASLLAIVCAIRWTRRRPFAWNEHPARGFALVAVLLPMFAFSFARNIIWTYALPMLAPAAALLGAACAPWLARAGALRILAWSVLCIQGAMACAAILTWVPRHVAAHSSAPLIERLHAEAPGELFYLGRKSPASLRFYTRGSVRPIADATEAAGSANPDRASYLAVAPAQVEAVRAALARQAAPLAADVVAANEDLALLRLRPASGR